MRPSGRIVLPPKHGAVASSRPVMVSSMIASNRHGHPPLTPGSACDPILDLPDFYLDAKFRELSPGAGDRANDADLRQSEERLEDAA